MPYKGFGARSTDADDPEPGPLRNATVSISSTIVTCLKAFNQFIDETQDTDEQTPAGFVVQPWRDELGRLRIWAANIGAHQTNQSSLDYRLRDSAHIRNQIIKLLDDLVKRLGEARSFIQNDTVDGDDEDVESLQGSSSEDEEPQSETQQLQRSVATIINCLFQMSMLVRKPAQHDLRIASRKADVAHFEHFDHNHVRDKYPGADDLIVSRLGRAITRRRMYLKYRERHAMKLKQGINTAVGVKDNATSAGALSETVVTDALSRNIEFQDNASDSGISRTSYAPTLMSGGNITIPAPPKASKGGEPFECPYCRFIINAQSTRSWNRHVFNDLQPYICIEKSCITPDKLYATRHEWIRHRRTVHPVENSTHKRQIESHRCSLCGDTQSTKEQHERHVARHLQKLALFILPRNDEESDENPDTNSDSNLDEHLEVDRAENHARPLPDDEAEHLIKCVCGFEDIDDPSFVLCQGCGTWQHTQCYLEGYDDALDYKEFRHYCVDCAPRQLDARAAVARQTVRRKLQHENNASRSRGSNSFASQMDALDDNDRVPTTSDDLSSGETSSDEDFVTTAKTEEVNSDSERMQNSKKLPTYIKVHRDYISPDTLEAYEIPWTLDFHDRNSIIIDQWITKDKQEQLFEHTRKLKEGRMIREVEVLKHQKSPNESLAGSERVIKDYPETANKASSTTDSDHEVKRKIVDLTATSGSPSPDIDRLRRQTDNSESDFEAGESSAIRSGRDKDVEISTENRRQSMLEERSTTLEGDPEGAFHSKSSTRSAMDEPPYICPSCKEIFQKIDALRDHALRHHLNEDDLSAEWEKWELEIQKMGKARKITADEAAIL